MKTYNNNTTLLSNEIFLMTRAPLMSVNTNMKPEILYIIIADNVIVEEKTGKLSIIGIFYAINLPSKQNLTILPSMTVLARISNAKGRKEAKVNIIDPDGVIIATVVLKGDIPDNYLNLRAIFQGLQFSKTGTYRISIQLDDELITSEDSYSFEVKKTKE